MKLLATLAVIMSCLSVFGQTPLPPLGPDAAIVPVATPYTAAWLRATTNPGTGLGFLGGVSVVGISSNLPSIATNFITSQQWLTFSTFQVIPANQNSIWRFAGNALTNLICPNTNAPILTDAAFQLVRDPSQFKWIDNNGNVFYLITYGAYFTGSASNIVGVAQSFDGGMSYYKLGTIDFAGAHRAQWSPKLSINSTNGLELTVGLGANNGSGPTNNFICDINTANFTNWSNLRVLGQRLVGGSLGEQSSGIIVYFNGLYNYFDSASQQFTNSTLGPTGWGFAYNDGTSTSTFSGLAGPTVVKFNGIWYWFVTDGALAYVYSTNMADWFGSTGQKVFYPPYDGGVGLSGPLQEGTAIVENYATQPGVSVGLFKGVFAGSGTSVTNLQASNLFGTITNTIASIGGISGNGSGLTNLNGSNIASGTVVAARLPAALQTLNANDGSVLTNLVSTITSSAQPMVVPNPISGALTESFNGSAVTNQSVANFSAGNMSSSNQWVGRFVGNAQDLTNAVALANLTANSVVSSNQASQISGLLVANFANTNLTTTFSNNAAVGVLFQQNINNFAQPLVVQNTSSGASASGEVSIRADNGSSTNAFFSFGINSSAFVGGPAPIGTNTGFILLMGNPTNYATGSNTPTIMEATSQTNSSINWSAGNGITRTNMQLNDAGLTLNSGTLTAPTIVGTTSVAISGGGTTMTATTLAIGGSGGMLSINADATMTRLGAGIFKIGNTAGQNGSLFASNGVFQGNVISTNGFTAASGGVFSGNGSGLTNLPPSGINQNANPHIPIAVTVGASPFTFTNTGPSDLEFYFTDSAAYAIAFNGLTIVPSGLLNLSYPLTVPPTNYITLTFLTTAPTLLTNALH